MSRTAQNVAHLSEIYAEFLYILAISNSASVLQYTDDLQHTH